MQFHFQGPPLYEYGQQLGVIGSSVDEEEAYLEGLFSALTYKMAYVNLNGSNVSEVLVWELMVYILVKKEYEKLLALNPKVGSDVVKAEQPKAADRLPSVVNSGSNSILAILIRKIKRRSFSIPCRPYIGNFLLRTIVQKGHFINIPESVLFMMIKAGLYVEYLFIRLYAITQSKTYYKYASPGLTRNSKVEDGYHKRFPDKKIVSLRNIVVEERCSSNDITEQNRIKLLNGL